MPLLSGLRVARSSIHGYGVITTRPFARGEILVEGDGVQYSEDDDFDDTYALVLPGWDATGGDDDDAPQVYFDLIDQTRWINHACDPNTYVDTDWDEATKSARAWWTATRTIEPGEELTYDYEFSAECAEPCACGCKTCRGVIVDLAEADQLSPELRAQLK